MTDLLRQWELRPNPAYAGRKPTILKAECHDRTPFISVMCRCGGEMHIHESQLDAIPDDAEIAAPCKSCGDPLIFPPGYFRAAFADLRAEGWIE